MAKDRDCPPRSSKQCFAQFKPQTGSFVPFWPLLRICMGTRHGVKWFSFVHQPKLWCRDIFRCVAWRLIFFSPCPLQRFFRRALQEMYHWMVEGQAAASSPSTFRWCYLKNLHFLERCLQRKICSVIITNILFFFKKEKLECWLFYYYLLLLRLFTSCTLFASVMIFARTNRWCTW